MLWVTKQLREGWKVYCIRSKKTGLVVCMMATRDVPTKRDGAPLFESVEDYTVTPIWMRNGKAVWGVEAPWPGSNEELEKRQALEAALFKTDHETETERTGH
jgi:hypothetical protein